MRAEAAIRELLEACGLDADDPRLVRTPERVAAAAVELLGGEGIDTVPMLRAGRISVDGDPSIHASAATEGPISTTTEPVEVHTDGNLVLVRNIRFRAMCEHHLLPFDGWVHLAYLPSDAIIGFGRLYELVEICSSRLILQERLGEDIVDALMAGLDAQGALAVIEARQGCVADRGPRQSDSDSVTLAARGALRDSQVRADALRLIALGGSSREKQ